MRFGVYFLAVSPIEKFFVDSIRYFLCTIERQSLCTIPHSLFIFNQPYIFIFLDINWVIKLKQF